MKSFSVTLLYISIEMTSKTDLREKLQNDFSRKLKLDFVTVARHTCRPSYPAKTLITLTFRAFESCWPKSATQKRTSVSECPFLTFEFFIFLSLCQKSATQKRTSVSECLFLVHSFVGIRRLELIHPSGSNFWIFPLVILWGRTWIIKRTWTSFVLICFLY